MQVSKFVPEEVHFARAQSARDLALPLLRASGTWEEVDNYPGKVRSFEQDQLFMLHRTPFQPVPISEDAEALGISAGLQRDAARAYGLDVWWQRRKVLSVIWNDGGPLGLIVFKEGPWEEALQAYAAATAEAVGP
jgi:hypothetical protein